MIGSAAGLQSWHETAGAVVGLPTSADKTCVALTSQDGTCFTAPISIGQIKTAADIVVDTGSTQLLVQSSKATPTTHHTGRKTILSYGSGDVEVEECHDQVVFGGDTPTGNNKSIPEETIYLMGQANAQVFSDIEGILPLSMEEQNVIHTTSFSLCMSDRAGALKLHSSGASVSANSRWEIPLKGITVGETHVGISNAQILPDSGTTLLLGPLDQLEKLFSAACSQWSACTGSDANAFIEAIDALGGDCSSNAPDISFNLGGESVTVTASSYVMKWQGTCFPAFDYFDYDNLWILGLPLFYDNEIAFDVTTSKVGFTAGSCGGCSAGLAQDRKSKQGVREISGPPRQPTLKRAGSKLSAVNARNPDLMRLAKALDKRQWN